MVFKAVNIDDIQLDDTRQVAKQEEYSGYTPIDINNIVLDTPESNLVDTESQKGLKERIGEDVVKRVGEAKDIEKSYKEGDIGLPRATYQYIGKVGAGTLLDLVQEGTVSAFRALPDFIEEPIREAGKKVAESPIGKIGIAALQKGGEAWESFKDENPEIARDVEATTNFISLGMLVNPKSSAKLAKDATEKAGKTAAKVAITPARVATDGAKKIAQGIATRTPEELDDALLALKNEVSPLFEQSREMGVLINKNKAKNISNNVKNNLDIDFSRKSSKALYGDIMSVAEDMADDVAKGNFGVNDLHDYRKLFQETVTKNIVSNPAVANKARKAVDIIDESLSGLKPINLVGGNKESVDLLLDGISKWKNVKKFEEFSDIVKGAGGDPNKIRSAFKRLSNNKKKFNKLSKQEKAIVRAIADPSKADKIMKGLGRFGLEPNNIFLPIVSGGLGTLSGFGAPTTALVGVGTAARQARKFATRAEPERLLKTIEERIK